MRVGVNAGKKKEEINYKLFRVISPIYIPNLEGYYSDALKVLKNSLESLIKTSSVEHTSITLILNGCCEEVTSYVIEFSKKNAIDKLTINGDNQGKVSPVYQEALAAHEKLITVVDSDILFYPNWQTETLDIFNAFPYTGSVALLRMPHNVYRNTYVTLLHSFVTRKLKVEKLLSDQDLEVIYKSIDRVGTKMHLTSKGEPQLTVKNQNVKALVGCNHAAATYRKQFFGKYKGALKYKFLPQQRAEVQLLDIPIENAGCWRLSVANKSAYHMGNSHQLAYDGIVEQFPEGVKGDFSLQSLTAKRSVLRIVSYRFRYYAVAGLRALNIFRCKQPFAGNLSFTHPIS
jgi:hypothetical protein